MSDLISRQAAIDAIDIFVKVDEENCTEYDIGYNDGIDFAISSLAVLPSAQPEPKTGEWIKIDKYDKESNVQCSACLEEFDYIDGVCYLCHGYELPPFCPSCGAKMGG